MSPDRITSKHLENQLEKLSERTGLDLQLARWSPGDGWTRNQLLAKKDGGGLIKISEVMKSREMYLYIRGYMEIDYEA